jgi:hypothetical protein
VFFLRISKWLNERELFLEFEFKPIFKPEAALACGQAKGEI